MDFIKLAADRFSTRDFSEKTIEEQKLEIIKEAARVAPTAKNNQPQILYLLKSEEALKKIRENTSDLASKLDKNLLFYKRRNRLHGNSKG